MIGGLRVLTEWIAWGIYRAGATKAGNFEAPAHQQGRDWTSRNIERVEEVVFRILLFGGLILMLSKFTSFPDAVIKSASILSAAFALLHLPHIKHWLFWKIRNPEERQASRTAWSDWLFGTPTRFVAGVYLQILWCAYPFVVIYQLVMAKTYVRILILVRPSFLTDVSFTHDIGVRHILPSRATRLHQWNNHLIDKQPLPEDLVGFKPNWLERYITGRRRWGVAPPHRKTLNAGA